MLHRFLSLPLTRRALGSPLPPLLLDAALNRAATPPLGARCSLSPVFLSAVSPLSLVSALASLSMLHAYCFLVPCMLDLIMPYRYTVLPTDTARRTAVLMHRS